MRTVETLLAHPVFQTLGWTLLHFVWQGALVALLYAGVSLTLRRSTANARYTFACLSLLLMLALPVATFFHLDAAARRAFASGERARDNALDAPAATADAAAAERRLGALEARLYANLLLVPGDEAASAPLQR